MVNTQDRKIYIPDDVWTSLTFYVNDERLRVSEDVRESITNKTMIFNILKNHLHRMGHYPPKVVEQKKESL